MVGEGEGGVHRPPPPLAVAMRVSGTRSACSAKRQRRAQFCLARLKAMQARTGQVPRGKQAPGITAACAKRVHCHRHARSRRQHHLLQSMRTVCIADPFTCPTPIMQSPRRHTPGKHSPADMQFSFACRVPTQTSIWTTPPQCTGQCATQAVTVEVAKTLAKTPRKSIFIFFEKYMFFY